MTGLYVTMAVAFAFPVVVIAVHRFHERRVHRRASRRHKEKIVL